MKVRIDTQAKTIAIEEAVTFDELHKLLKSLFPADYKQWKVETNVKFEITSSPIVVHPFRPYWENPFYYGGGWCGTGGTTLEAVSACGTVTTNASPQMVGSSNGVYFLDIEN